MRQSHLILSNALIMWGSRALLLIPQLILVPYLLHSIGAVGYGVYAMVWALIMSIDHLVQSLQAGVVKYGAGFLSQGRDGDVNKIFSSSFVFCLGLGVLACFAILVAAALYRTSNPNMSYALLVVAVLSLVIIPVTPYVGIIQSTQRYYVNAIAATLANYVGIAAIVLWFTFNAPSVTSALLIMMGLLFISRLAQVPLAHYFVPGLRNRLSAFDVGSFRTIAAFGSATVILGLCLAVNSTGIRWLMGSLVSSRFVAELVIMIMPATLLAQVIAAATITVMPATSVYEASRDREVLGALLTRGVRYTTIMTLAALLAAMFLMGDVITLWVGTQYAFLAPYAIVIFAGWALLMSTSVSHHMLKGLGRLRGAIVAYLVGFVVVPVVLIVAIFLASANAYVAVAVGLAGGCVATGFLQMLYCKSAIGVNLRAILWRQWLPPVVVALFVGVSALAIDAFTNVSSLFAHLALSGTAIAFFLVASYLYVATPDERTEARELLRVAMRKLSTATTRSAGPIR